MTWVDEASIIFAHVEGKQMDQPSRAVWIVSNDETEAVGARQVAMRCNIMNNAPHFVYHPIDGEFIQMVSLNRQARSLKEAKDFIQVLVVAQDERPFTEFPCPNLSHVVASLDSRSVPRSWPSGPPTTFSVRGTHTEPGNYGAMQISNERGPGAIDIRRLMTA